MHLVLLHSPLVGPATLRPLAATLAASGVEAVLPDLRPSLVGPPPYWRAWAELAARSCDGLRGDLVLAGHSGAGRLLPAVAAALGRSPGAYVFIDAGLPFDGESHLTRAPMSFRQVVESLLAPDGRLPPWTSWWPDTLMQRLLPDHAQRATLAADCPRVPAALMDEPISVPGAWPDAGCIYISSSYEDEAGEAESRGWPVLRLGGTHLSVVSDPLPIRDAIFEGLQILQRPPA